VARMLIYCYIELGERIRELSRFLIRMYVSWVFLSFCVTVDASSASRTAMHNITSHNGICLSGLLWLIICVLLFCYFALLTAAAIVMLDALLGWLVKPKKLPVAGHPMGNLTSFGHACHHTVRAGGGFGSTDLLVAQQEAVLGRRNGNLLVGQRALWLLLLFLSFCVAVDASSSRKDDITHHDMRTVCAMKGCGITDVFIQEGKRELDDLASYTAMHNITSHNGICLSGLAWLMTCMLPFCCFALFTVAAIVILGASLGWLVRARKLPVAGHPMGNLTSFGQTCHPSLLLDLSCYVARLLVCRRSWGSNRFMIDLLGASLLCLIIKCGSLSWIMSGMLTFYCLTMFIFAKKGLVSAPLASPSSCRRFIRPAMWRRELWKVSKGMCFSLKACVNMMCPKAWYGCDMLAWLCETLVRYMVGPLLLRIMRLYWLLEDVLQWIWDVVLGAKTTYVLIMVARMLIYCYIELGERTRELSRFFIRMYVSWVGILLITIQAMGAVVLLYEGAGVGRLIRNRADVRNLISGGLLVGVLLGFLVNTNVLFFVWNWGSGLLLPVIHPVKVWLGEISERIEYNWNILSTLRLDRTIYRLRNKRWVCRLRWRFLRKDSWVWIEKWETYYAGGLASWDKHRAEAKYQWNKQEAL